MDHHKRPFDTSGPEFEGLSSDERFALKKQLRIRDRNRHINEMMWRRQRASRANAFIACLGFAFSFIISFAFLLWMALR